MKQSGNIQIIILAITAIIALGIMIFLPKGKQEVGSANNPYLSIYPSNPVSTSRPSPSIDTKRFIDCTDKTSDTRHCKLLKHAIEFDYPSFLKLNYRDQDRSGGVGEISYVTLTKDSKQLLKLYPSQGGTDFPEVSIEPFIYKGAQLYKGSGKLEKFKAPRKDPSKPNSGAYVAFIRYSDTNKNPIMINCTADGDEEELCDSLIDSLIID